MRTRRNIKYLTESDKTKFVNVVLELKS